MLAPLHRPQVRGPGFVSPEDASARPAKASYVGLYSCPRVGSLPVDTLAIAVATPLLVSRIPAEAHAAALATVGVMGGGLLLVVAMCVLFPMVLVLAAPQEARA